MLELSDNRIAAYEVLKELKYRIKRMSKQQKTIGNDQAVLKNN